jgi:ADP-ribosylglycohydrolase
MALGDAMGAPTEFLTVDEIVKRWPPAGPTDMTGNPIRVTDDTQMALAVGEALIEANSSGPLTPQSLEISLRKHFVEWLNSPDNNRAPGMTCLAACENLETGMPWQEATRDGSKGCGANMRVSPVGLLRGLSQEQRAAISQFQSALTHGHPTALAASDLTAFAIADLVNGGNTAGLVARLRRYAETQRFVYHEEWLGTLWERPAIDSPEEFISRGWDECLFVLSRLEAAVTLPDRESDPCLATGDGWIAEEAFATGCLCFLFFPDEPQKAIQRAAVSSGDSDSIACIAGAFAGARNGISKWPDEWLERIEYRQRLIDLSIGLASL